MFDVKCCTARDRSHFDPQRFCAGRSPKETLAPACVEHRPPNSSLSKGPQCERDSISSLGDSISLEGEDVDNRRHSTCNSKLHLLPPHSPHCLSRELVDKLAELVRKNPYMAREIGERASRSLRLLFLKQCMLRRYSQCERIWSAMDERKRLDFMQVLHMGRRTHESFFLSIMEPDENTWRDELSDYSLSEFDLRSESGSATSDDQHVCRGYTRSNCSNVT